MFYPMCFWSEWNKWCIFRAVTFFTFKTTQIGVIVVFQTKEHNCEVAKPTQKIRFIYKKMSMQSLPNFVDFGEEIKGMIRH